MGDIDINVKNFIKLRSVFAELFSEGVFHGEGASKVGGCDASGNMVCFKCDHG